MSQPNEKSILEFSPKQSPQSPRSNIQSTSSAPITAPRSVSFQKVSSIHYDVAAGRGNYDDGYPSSDYSANFYCSPNRGNSQFSKSQDNLSLQRYQSAPIQNNFKGKSRNTRRDDKSFPSNRGNSMNYQNKHGGRNFDNKNQNSNSSYHFNQSTPHSPSQPDVRKQKAEPQVICEFRPLLTKKTSE